MGQSLISKPNHYTNNRIDMCAYVKEAAEVSIIISRPSQQIQRSARHVAVAAEGTGFRRTLLLPARKKSTTLCVRVIFPQGVVAPCLALTRITSACWLVGERICPLCAYTAWPRLPYDSPCVAALNFSSTCTECCSEGDGVMAASLRVRFFIFLLSLSELDAPQSGYFPTSFSFYVQFPLSQRTHFAKIPDTSDMVFPFHKK